MSRERLYELIKKLEEPKGFTPEGALLREFVRQNTTKKVVAALFKPKEK